MLVPEGTRIQKQQNLILYRPMTGERRRAGNRLREKKGKQHGLSNYMFCLNRRCVYRPPISVSEFHGWSSWRRKESSRPLTLSQPREEHVDNRSTRAFNQRLYLYSMLLFYSAVQGLPQLEGQHRYRGYVRIPKKHYSISSRLTTP